METLWQDIRYGVRMLVKAPSLSIVATIALALGIGANTAIFSVVNSVLLRPLPFANSEALMNVWETDSVRGSTRGSASYPNFADWRDQNRVFETGKHLALARWLSTPTVAGMAAALAHADAATELPDVESDHERRSRPFPLTAVQQAYWLGRRDDFALGGVATHAYGELPFDNLDADRFERVWNRLIARHDMLRMVVGADGQQRILGEVPHYRVARIDARGEAGASRLAQTRAELSHQVLAPDVWPLFEVRLSRHEGSRWLIHVSLDALALDLGSIHILSRELSMLYRDEQASLPALTLSFRDYVLAEQRLCGTPRYARAQAYWHARLADLPGGPDLPLARDPGPGPAPAVRTAIVPSPPFRVERTQGRRGHAAGFSDHRARRRVCAGPVPVLAHGAFLPELHPVQSTAPACAGRCAGRRLHLADLAGSRLAPE